jgi:hypothetical protein
MGCGSADSPAGAPPTNAAPFDPSEIAFKASPDALTEFGVAWWTISVVTVEGWVKGRDAAGTVVAEFTGTDGTTSDGTGRTVQFVVRHGNQSVATTIALDRSNGTVVDVRILEDSFATDPSAKRMLDLLIADLPAGQQASSSPPPASGAQTGVATNSLKPLDANSLVQGCVATNARSCPPTVPYHVASPCNKQNAHEVALGARAASACAPYSLADVRFSRSGFRPDPVTAACIADLDAYDGASKIDAECREPAMCCPNLVRISPGFNSDLYNRCIATEGNYEDRCCEYAGGTLENAPGATCQ